jgi:hypothetical protein
MQGTVTVAQNKYHEATRRVERVEIAIDVAEGTVSLVGFGPRGGRYPILAQVPVATLLQFCRAVAALLKDEAPRESERPATGVPW